MILLQLRLQQITLTAATMALVSFSNSPVLAQAQSKPTVPTQQQPQQRTPSEQKKATSRFVLPTPPDRGTPGKREAAASRGGCPVVDTPLTALVPVYKNYSQDGIPVESIWSLTVAERPTFWFYVPYSSSSLDSVEFVLQDEADNDIYQAPVRIPKTPGIVSVRLPSTSKPLLAGKMYHWFFKVRCASQNTAGPIFVEGWVQRNTLSPTLKNQLEAATPLQRIALYAQNGIWYDALTTLAELRLQKPEDTSLKANWNELFHLVGLSEVASQSLVK